VTFWFPIEHTCCRTVKILCSTNSPFLHKADQMVSLKISSSNTRPYILIPQCKKFTNDNVKMAHMKYVLSLHSTFYEPSDHNISYYMQSNTQVPGLMLLHKYGLVQKPVVAGFCYFIL